MSAAVHATVLRDEVVEALAPHSGGRYADCTLGLGGHAEAILFACRPDGEVIGIDRDVDALERARARLRSFGDSFRAVEGSFSELESLVEGPLDGVVADLGISSLQLDSEARGFAFRFDGPLDMRMGPSVGPTAHEFLSTSSVDEIGRVLRSYGEVRGARRIATEIHQAAKKGELETTGALAALVERLNPRRGRKTHPATQVFQAIRIHVNRELEELETLLAVLPKVVKPGGRVAMISFHSLEDRRVKHIMVPPVEADHPELPRGLPVAPPEPGYWKRLSSKPICPSDDEVRENPRARSAKLRVFERTERRCA